MQTPRAQLRTVHITQVGLEVIAVMKEASRVNAQKNANNQNANGGQNKNGSNNQNSGKNANDRSLGNFFPQSSYGNNFGSKSTESYGSHHNSVTLFDPEVLMAGRLDRSSLQGKQNT